MADDLSIFINANEEIAVLHEIERPVHRAVHLGKILCPNDHCVNNKYFFLENGIVHHYRIKHKQLNKILRALKEENLLEYAMIYISKKQENAWKRLFDMDIGVFTIVQQPF